MENEKHNIVRFKHKPLNDGAVNSSKLKQFLRSYNETWSDGFIAANYNQCSVDDQFCTAIFKTADDLSKHMNEHKTRGLQLRPYFGKFEDEWCDREQTYCDQQQLLKFLRQLSIDYKQQDETDQSFKKETDKVERMIYTLMISDRQNKDSKTHRRTLKQLYNDVVYIGASKLMICNKLQNYEIEDNRPLHKVLFSYLVIALQLTKSPDLSPPNVL